jgi:hypothetical protein
MPRAKPLLLPVDDDEVVRWFAATVGLRRLLVEPDAVVNLASLAIVGHRQARALGTLTEHPSEGASRSPGILRAVSKNSSGPVRASSLGRQLDSARSRPSAASLLQAGVGELQVFHSFFGFPRRSVAFFSPVFTSWRSGTQRRFSSKGGNFAFPAK